jgi:hypothetical protein
MFHRAGPGGPEAVYPGPGDLLAALGDSLLTQGAGRS